jgi:uncharacterized protein (TIGR03437 family)
MGSDVHQKLDRGFAIFRPMSRISAALLCVITIGTLPLEAQPLPVGAQPDAVVVGFDGSFYIAGQIGSAELPVTPGAFQTTPPAACTTTNPLCAGFVAKVAPNGRSLVWATYFGAAGTPAATGLAVSSTGGVYIASSSGVAAQLPLHGYQTAAANIYVAELSADGSTLLGGTYFGGLASASDPSDSVASLRLDAAGNVYLAGTAQTANFPTTPGAYRRQPVPASSTDICGEGPSSDMFAAKFDAGLNQLIFSTLVGSDSQQQAADLTLGIDGSLYVAGTDGSSTRSCNNPTLTRLTASGSAATYSLIVPALGYAGRAVAVETDGAAYLGGDNRDFPPPWRGSIWKIGPAGTVTGTLEIGGSIGSLATSAGSLVALGDASVGKLAVTPNSTPSCLPLDPSFLLTQHYVARLDVSPLAVLYAGYLPVSNAWPGGSGQVVASSVYTSYAPASMAPFAIVAAGPPAPGTVTCVSNAANYAGSGRPVAPGEVLTLFGYRIGPATPAVGSFGSDGNLGAELAGIQVFLDGLAAPLLYAGPNQVNLIAPFGIPTGTATLEFRRDGTTVASFDVRTGPVAPAFFTADGSGGGLAAALNQDGSINSVSSPAAPGSAVALFGTGMGAMTPQPVDGSRPANIANTPIARYTATVNGQQAAIEYIGNAPTVVEGVVQVNVRLPNPISGGFEAGIATIVLTTDQGLAVAEIIVR